MHRLTHAFAIAAVLALTLVGCASGKDTGLPAAPTTAPASKECSTIEMTDALAFSPNECTATVGQTVVWKNVGSAPHTVTSSDKPPKFDSKISSPVAGGGEYKFTFKAAGEYPYVCLLHAGMSGKVKVEAGSGGGTTGGGGGGPSATGSPSA